jgi:ABC-type transport system involved in cytochrome bd biosynthesis fused ATPase/permease subunit
LTSGQQQKLILARALAGKPSLLILDEPTSSLDIESENHFISNLNQLQNDMTIIIATHRLAPALIADHIIYLKDGEILETGKKCDLLNNKDSFFYKLVTKAVGGC